MNPYYYPPMTPSLGKQLLTASRGQPCLRKEWCWCAASAACAAAGFLFLGHVGLHSSPEHKTPKGLNQRPCSLIGPLESTALTGRFCRVIMAAQVHQPRLARPYSLG